MAACQQFRAEFPGKIVIDGLATQGTTAATHNAPIVTTSDSIKIFAGPRQDPFFFDLVGFKRAVASGDPSKFTGVDAFLDKNVQAIVVEFPLDMVFPAGACGLTPPFSTPCGVWAVTYLGKLKEHHDEDTFDPHPDGLRQVDRMGNPAVNMALIPRALNDAFNFGQPKDDAEDFASIILDQILTLDKRFGTCPPERHECGLVQSERAAADVGGRTRHPAVCLERQRRLPERAAPPGSDNRSADLTDSQCLPLHRRNDDQNLVPEFPVPATPAATGHVAAVQQQPANVRLKLHLRPAAHVAGRRPPYASLGA